jgi:hypothetical protein
MNDKNWKSLERLVAAINATQMSGAAVKWDDKINGRQFDVTIRFELGNYSYLTVVECKNQGRRVPVEKVEAFVTKSNGVNANKAVMVSTSGFQTGAIEVAKDHGVDLVILDEEVDYPEGDLISIVIPTANILNISLIRRGKRPPLEYEDGPKLHYLVLNTFIIKGSEKLTLDGVLSNWINKNCAVLTYDGDVFEIPIASGCLVEIPEKGILNNIRAIKFTVRVVDARPLTGPALDPYLMEKQHTYFRINNVIDGKDTRVKLSDIDHGFDTEIKEGCFYTAPSLGYNYYCEKIEGDLITWWLLESYQHGHKIDVTFTQTIENAKGYQLIVDTKLINRLRDRVRKYLER